MMCHLYFSRYKWFNYKYVHIIPNVLHLNTDFLILFFFSLYNVTSAGIESQSRTQFSFVHL